MKGFFIFPVLLIFLFSTSVFADFQKGWEAYYTRDYATALKEWKPLAEQGIAKAQYNLGVMYDKGQGVTQDYRAAFKWYKLAAEQGHAEAQGLVGAMYLEGRGVTQNHTFALMWWIIWAAQSDDRGADLRDQLQKLMTPTQIEKAKELAQECVAKNYKDC